jgi:hypothetical protein
MSKQNDRLSSAGSVRHAGLPLWLSMGLAFALVLSQAAGAQGLQAPAAPPFPQYHTGG